MSRGGALGTQISVIHQSLDVEIDTVYVLATPARLPTEEEKVRLLNSTIMKNWHFLSLQNLLCLLVAEVEEQCILHTPTTTCVSYLQFQIWYSGVRLFEMTTIFRTSQAEAAEAELRQKRQKLDEHRQQPYKPFFTRTSVRKEKTKLGFSVSRNLRSNLSKLSIIVASPGGDIIAMRRYSMAMPYAANDTRSHALTPIA
eukprot:1194850-Prorocentrum_minimum.AAC.11